ncbi:MAG: SusC/RagA family TonB-linked outer membrane protein [Petrimonas sp.]|nr:SusC/RagA family TonB-linked outer membrane protein [Petrimonas sp.]
MKRYSITILSFIVIFFSNFIYAAEEISVKEEKLINEPNIQKEDQDKTPIKNDTVNIAFKKIQTDQIVGAVSTLKAPEIYDYDNTIWAGDVLAGRTLGMMGNTNIRGIGISIDVADLTGSGNFSGNALFIVDGLPRDIESLRLSEVENITVLKDVNAAMLYGSAAINGVVLITTKRGKAYDNYSNFSLNYGLSTPLALPKYLNAADYMTYYNQARANDGLSSVYSDEMIQNYRTGNKYRYPDVDYYSNEYVKSFRPYYDLVGEFSGGNEVAKYYLNFGMNSLGSLLNFGEGAKAKYNTFNVRGNVDLKIIDQINTSIDATALFGNDRGPRGNYWSSASTLRPYEYTPLIPIDLIDPENTLLLGRKNDVDGKYLIGGNLNNQTTPFGDGYAGGVFERIERKFSFNNRINFDLGNLTEGLSFHTNLSFDYYTRFDQTVANQYSSYEAVWAPDEDKITDLKQYGTDARSGTQVVGNTIFRRRIGFYGLFNYDRYFNDVHHLTASLLGYGSIFKETNDFQGVKHAHMGLRIGYDYASKYLLDFSSVYVNSVKLAPSNRTGFSPSLGLAWIASSEDFLESSENINFLKFRISTGILNSDLPIGGFFYYDNRYGGAGGYSWYEGTRSRGGVMSNWEQNYNLGFGKRKEINVGFEGLFFNKILGVEANVFHDIYSDLITRPDTRYPGFYSDFIPYENFEKDSYDGAEIGLSINKSFGDWNLFFGANALYVTSKRLVVDEVYANDYQYRKGYPKDATFGLQAIGLFKDQADIDSSPLQTFGTVHPGDIKYKDQNGDGIVDANDEVYLRRWQAPFSGGLQAKISYKNLMLFMLGEGRSGSETFKEGNYYWVDGNDKYSEVVLDSWTPETAGTATYPRLSSQANNNNSRRSSYWLYNNDYFQIRKVQLTYKMPEGITKSLLMKEFDIFVDASNVYQFAPNKKIRETRVGAEPYYRTFSLGFRTKF